MTRTIGSELFEQDTWSRDGRTIRFDRNNKIFEIGSDGTGLHEFLPAWKPSSWRCCGHWTRDGRFYLFVAWDAPLGTYPLHPPAQIWALDERRGLLTREVAEPFQLTSGPIRWARPIPSKDGTKIFARGVIPNGELESLDPQSHQFQPYLHGISAESVSFSPDGKSVAYVSYPEGILWRANRDGSGPVQLTDPPIYPVFARWSPDGMHMLFCDAHFVGYNKSYILSSQGGMPEQILPGDKSGEQDAVWSPDGHRIAFTSSESSDGNERPFIRVLDLASHQVTKVAGSEERHSPRWSPDGKYLVALNVKDGSISIFDFQTQQWKTLFEKGNDDYPNWSRDGKFVYFVRAQDDPGVFRIRVSDRKVEKMADLTGFRFISVLGPWMGLDPDDNPLLMRDTGGDDIYALTLERK
jgi:WD40 repeat protein